MHHAPRAIPVDLDNQHDDAVRIFRAREKVFRFPFQLRRASQGVPASVAPVRSLKLKSKRIFESLQRSSRGHNPKIKQRSADAIRITRIAPSFSDQVFVAPVIRITLRKVLLLYLGQGPNQQAMACSPAIS
jgi:hypothetical protein